jgi:tripartite-type tricarboxylate transporter receptor subunit TctC
MVVDPSQPWTSARELVNDAKAHPGKLTYAHAGVGGLPYLSGELFMVRAGVNLVTVPYRSVGELATAVLTRAVDVTIADIGVMLPLVREGKLKALAVTNRTRTPLAPDVPTMMESGVPDYEVITFSGLVAPAGTSEGIVRKLNGAINEGLRSPEAQAIVARLGAMPHPGTPEDFGAFITAKRQHWESVVQAIGAKAN